MVLRQPHCLQFQFDVIYKPPLLWILWLLAEPSAIGGSRLL